MVSIVKSEWHQVEKRYGIEITEDILSEIYYDLDEDELAQKLADLESKVIGPGDIIDDANEANVDLDWEWLNQDDWWTDRKGGYDITYNVEDWEYNEPYVSPLTHKCLQCKWVGTKWDTTRISIPDNNGIESGDAKHVCPMCDSDLELTPEGVKEQKETEERDARWAREEYAVEGENE
jgi:hypothetical protein